MDKQDIIAEMDKVLATELLERVRSGVATAAELREARAYLNDNKDLLGFKQDHPAHELGHLPDLNDLPEVFTVQ